MADEIVRRRIERTAAVVSAYVAGNRIRTVELVGVITSVGQTFRRLALPPIPKHPPAPAPQTPTVPIEASITHDFLFSLEDGQPYRMLAMHLKYRGLTPDMYRAKWGLPRDYPMTAPAFSEKRSGLTKRLGLGPKGATSGHRKVKGRIARK